MNPFEPVVRRVTIPTGQAREVFEALSGSVGCTNAAEYKGKPPGAVYLCNVSGDLPNGAEEWVITFEFRPNPIFTTYPHFYRRIDFEADLFGDWMEEDEADTPVIVYAQEP